MKEKSSLLRSAYIIDGVQSECSPAMMLDAACGKSKVSGPKGEPIVDETLDPGPSKEAFDSWKADHYLDLVLPLTGSPREVRPCYSGPSARLCVAKALIDAIWHKGHFRLGDLCLSASWEWNPAPVGSGAAFFESVRQLCEYLDALGLRLGRYSAREGEKCLLSLKASLDGQESGLPDPDFFDELPYRSSSPVFGRTRALPGKVCGDKDGWLVYIPFDTCNFRLGGSLLSEALGEDGGKSPDLQDPDYFIDCYEVVRELVEDGVAISGVTVGPGGLMAALHALAGGSGINADIGGIMASYAESDMIRILFGEVPGVLIEIRDSDYDYLDAELLLQDVAYYPVGHPGAARPGVRIGTGGGISGILQSLMDYGAPEGED